MRSEQVLQNPKQLLSGSGAYDGSGTAGVERRAHEIETDYWRGSWDSL